MIIQSLKIFTSQHFADRDQMSISMKQIEGERNFIACDSLLNMYPEPNS